MTEFTALVHSILPLVLQYQTEKKNLIQLSPFMRNISIVLFLPAVIADKCFLNTVPTLR